MKRLHYVKHLLYHYKYLCSVGIFLLIVGVLDANSIMHTWNNKEEISRLKSEIATYKEHYEETQRQLRELDENPQAIKKYARERYFMKAADEDVYVFASTDSITS